MGHSLYHNIHLKRKRIREGSGETMRKKGDAGAPSDQDFKDAMKTSKYFKKKKKKYGGVNKLKIPSKTRRDYG